MRILKQLLILKYHMNANANSNDTDIKNIITMNAHTNANNNLYK